MSSSSALAWPSRIASGSVGVELAQFDGRVDRRRRIRLALATSFSRRPSRQRRARTSGPHWHRCPRGAPGAASMPGVEQHIRERRGLRGRIPAVDDRATDRPRRRPRPASRASASSNGSPRSIAVRMKFVVLLTTPRNPRTVDGRHRLAHQIEDRECRPSPRPRTRNDTPAGRRLRARARDTRTRPGPCSR